ncbi:MAG TPA: hypothetical protein VNW97_23020 [Candidatus Saccharimonadales bacterium]|nr:hypothetical protein [Candidatus Saccharimonadales bacterium]
MNSALRIVEACLQGTALVIIVHRKHHRQFPFFLAYAGASALISTILTVMSGLTNQERWFKLNWASQVIYTVLGILAMHESFRKVLRPYFLGKWWFHLLVPGVVAVVLVLCGWAAFRKFPGRGEYWLYFTSYLASDYMRAAIFGLFAILAIFWRARWQPCAFGVMKGFGFYTIVGMLADLLRSDFGTKMDLFFRYVPPVAYIVACLIWLGAFLQREPESRSGQTGSLADLDEILELLTRLKKARE